jgi:hypothetical protein
LRAVEHAVRWGLAPDGDDLRALPFSMCKANVSDRPFANPDAAARKLMELANAFEPVQDGRIYVEKINAPLKRRHCTPLRTCALKRPAVRQRRRRSSGRPET